MAPGAAPTGPGRGLRRPIPFGVHQVAEYGLAFILVTTSIHVSGGGLLVAGGVAFGLLAATGRGPTGLVRVCPPRVHATLDIAVALCLALAPILPSLRPDLTGILVVEFAAVGWLRLATLTTFTRRARDGRGHRGPPAKTATANAEPGTTPAAVDAQRDAPADRGPSAPSLGDLAQSALHDGARRLGQEAGRARRVWRRRSGHDG